MSICNNKKFFNNLIYGVMAQSITFLVSVTTSFILPKILGISEFAYWQLFIFYSSYVCFFHLGLPDGIYLKNGGRELEDLEQNKIACQFRLMILWQIIIALVFIGAAFFVSDAKRKYVIWMTAIYMIAVNFNNFYGMIYQAVSKSKYYSISIIVDKLVFLLSGFVLIACGIRNFFFFITAYCAARIVACFYSMSKCKTLFWGKADKEGIFLELKSNIRVGINIMLSVIASSMILGIGRFLIDRKWGIETFGVFSFALMLSNFVLQFLNQISIVLFPALRNFNENEIGNRYIELRKYLVLVLGLIPLLYIPLSWLIRCWLPQYEESIIYLALLLPISFFDGKTQMLAVTFLKVLRKEKILLRINLTTLALSAVMSIVGVYVLQNIYIVIWTIILVIVFRSCISEYLVMSYMKIGGKEKILTEVMLVSTYWLFTIFDKQAAAALIYGIFFCIYLFLVIKPFGSRKL